METVGMRYQAFARKPQDAASVALAHSRFHRAARRALEALEPRKLLSADHGIDVASNAHEHEGHSDHQPFWALPRQVQARHAESLESGAIRDESGAEFFFDAAPAYVPQQGPTADGDGGGGGGGGDLVLPILESNPSASRKVFLDFDGHVVSGTFWNEYNNNNPIHAPPYSTDSDLFNYSAAEVANIEEIWRRVAEDFAPFNVDVTTKDPGTAAFTEGARALRVMISTDRDEAAVGGTGNQWFSGAGGVAYLGSWRWTNDTPVWVFENNLGNGFPKYVTEAASHEVGHAFDLNHDGTSTTGYYNGHGSGPTGWAPLMGVGYDRQLSQWSKGEYSGANNQEDDLAIITQASNKVTFRTDAVGNSIASAATLRATNPTSTLRQFEGAGIIETRTDVDVWKLDLTGGDGHLTLEVAPFFFVDGYNNLDLKADLLNSAGTVVQSVNPVDDVDAFFDLDLAAGTYYVRVDGVGKGTTTTGYSDYGSLGQYDIFGDWEYGTTGGGTINETGGQVSFEAEGSTGSASGSGAASGHTWNQFSDTNAFGGSALRSAPNTGVNTGEGLNGPRRDYAINFSTTGTYYVWVRLKGTLADDSVHLGVNGSGISLGKYGVGVASDTWKWMDNIGNGGRMTVNVPAAGVRTLNLWMREDGVEADAFVLTKDPNFRPSNDPGGGGGGGGGGGEGGTVDFENLSAGNLGSVVYKDPSGFNFSSLPSGGGSTLGGLTVHGSGQGFATKVLQPSDWNRKLLIEREDDAAFDITSLDYAAGRWGEAGDAVVTGFLAGGGTQTANISYNSKTAAKLQLDWANVTKVEINFAGGVNAAYGVIDNLVFGDDGGGGGGGGGGEGGTTNFETYTVGNQGSAGINDASGFRFVNLPGSGGTSQGNLLIHGTGQGYASKVLQTENWSRKIVVSRTDGANFGLTGFDYGAGRWGEAGDALVTGFLATGGTVTANLAYSSKSLQNLAVNWSNLTRVEINWAGGVNGAYGVVDNFVFPSSAPSFSDTRI
jgi:hypothetical protein